MIDRVCAIILKPPQILLMHRKKQGREYYVIPGGTVEPGEKLHDACIREIKEETNFNIEPGEICFEQVNFGRHGYYYLIESFNGELRLGGPEALKNSPENWYQPEWIDFQKLAELNLLPEPVKIKIMELIERF